LKGTTDADGEQDDHEARYRKKLVASAIAIFRVAVTFQENLLSNRRQLCWLLRASGERPSGRGTEKADELAPS
jgi:hypothetical protein